MQTGPDVSHWRPVEDYQAIKNSGRSFLITKATDFKEGWWFIDPTWERNVTESRRVGLVPGVYLFLRSNARARDQANHFLRTIGDHRGLILAVDFEHANATDTSPASNPTPGQLSEAVQTIFDATGRWPWVYTNRGYWNSVGNPPRPGLCPLWHAEWEKSNYGPLYGGWNAPVAWQHTSKAVVPGVPLPCDDNFFFGTSTELEAHAWSGVPDCGRDMANAQERGWGTPDRIYETRATTLHTITVTGVRFSVHKRVAPLFGAFLTEITDRGYNINRVADDWSYAYRPIRGYTFEEARRDPDKWSNHAWGLAIDVNATKNPMSSTLITDMPPWIDEVAAKYGLRWGGNYSGRKDAMHFEFMLTPAAADQMVKELDVMTEAQMRELKQHITDELIRIIRISVGPDDASVPAGNYFARVDGNAAAARTEAGAAKSAVGQALVELTTIKTLVEQLAAATGADPAALAGAVWDEFSARAPRLEGDS